MIIGTTPQMPGMPESKIKFYLVRLNRKILVLGVETWSLNILSRSPFHLLNLSSLGFLELIPAGTVLGPGV